MSVYQKLNAARRKFHTLQLKKTGLNKFAGYSYFELSDFLIPALETFEEHQLCAYISFGKDVATMTIVDTEDASQIQLTSPMAEAQLKGCHPIQNLGAVETYTRRYLWVAALEIVEHDALDSSEPLKAKNDIRGTAKAMPALGGIGNELGPDVRNWLEEIAGYATDMVQAGEVEAAKGKIAEYELDETQNLYMQSCIKDSKVRKALGFVWTKKE